MSADVERVKAAILEHFISGPYGFRLHAEDAARAAIAAMDQPIKPRVRHRPTGVFSGDYYAITYDDCECQGWDMVLVHSCDGEPREGGQTLVARQNHLRTCAKYPHPTPEPDAAVERVATWLQSKAKRMRYINPDGAKQLGVAAMELMDGRFSAALTQGRES